MDVARRGVGVPVRNDAPNGYALAGSPAQPPYTVSGLSEEETMDAINEFLFTRVWGLPLIIWWFFIFIYPIGAVWPYFLFGYWFDRYLWNRDEITEILGEDIVRVLEGQRQTR